jgi:hypothetical protein
MSPATQRSWIISNFRISVTPTWNFGDAWVCCAPKVRQAI